MSLGIRQQAKSVKMFLITTDMLLPKAHRQKLIPKSLKHKLEFYFEC